MSNDAKTPEPGLFLNNRNVTVIYSLSIEILIAFFYTDSQSEKPSPALVE